MVLGFMNTRKYFIFHFHFGIFGIVAFKATLQHILFLLFMTIVMMAVIFVYVFVLHVLS